jgi:hypothetical protein
MSVTYRRRSVLIDHPEHLAETAQLRLEHRFRVVGGANSPTPAAPGLRADSRHRKSHEGGQTAVGACASSIGRRGLTWSRSTGWVASSGRGYGGRGARRTRRRGSGDGGISLPQPTQ